MLLLSQLACDADKHVIKEEEKEAHVDQDRNGILESDDDSNDYNPTILRVLITSAMGWIGLS